MKAVLLIAVAVICGRGLADDKETVAIEKVREWDRGREQTLSLTAEELKRRQQAFERVSEIIRKKIDSHYPWRSQDHQRLRDWVDEVEGYMGQVRTYMVANLLRSPVNEGRYRQLRADYQRNFDITVMNAPERNHQQQPAYNFPNEKQVWKDLGDSFRQLAFDLAIEKWQEDMDLRY